MEQLYSPTLKQREPAATTYTVFADGTPVPDGWRSQWEPLFAGRDPRQGIVWPIDLRERCTESMWPQHAFGTANAGVLVLWNRPRSAATIHTSQTPHWTDPRTPVLGGVPHTQIAGWLPGPAGVGWITAWRNLRKYLAAALEPFHLCQPMSAVMVAALNPTFGATGISDHAANVRALASGGSVDHIVRAVRPLLTLLCGRPVHKAVASAHWKPAFGEMRCVDHPTAWEGYGSGRRHGQQLIIPMFQAWALSGCIP